VLHHPVDTSIHDHDACDEELVRKKIKLEVMDQIDSLEDTVEMEISEVLHLDEDNEMTDDEIPCLPLTFTTPADLMWKLQKAEIIPASCDLPSQRPRSRRSEDDGMIGCDNEVSNHGKENDVSSSRDVMKDTVVIPSTSTGVEIVANIKKEKVGEIIGIEANEDSLEEEESNPIEDRSALSKDKDEKGVYKENSFNQSCPQMSMTSLLHKPPRLGLSKLYRTSTSLHDISIIEKGDKRTFQGELSIIEKEE